MPKTIRLGLIGLDHWYTAFASLDAAREASNVKLVGVADSSRRRLAEVESGYSPVYVTRDHEKVIEDPDIDLICSLVPTKENVKVVRAALKAGKHVACVKPMAMTLRQADSLIELAETSDLVLWSFDQLGRAGSDYLRRALSRGAIGQPFTFHEVMWAGPPKPWRDRTGRSWWTDEKLVPFGAWGDHAIYSLDVLRFIFDAEVESIEGQIANKRHPSLKLEDYGLSVLQLTNGVTAMLEHAWIGGPYRAHWTKICGTKGAIHMERGLGEGGPTLATERGFKPIKRGKSGGFLDPVLALVRKGAAKPSPARESRTNLAAAFAFYQAARTGRRVTL
ncbi:MAG: Gfo/Idh/MocA family oxidoreductase [Armatimonadetes bacterium]|nr:Gfo/Idh/MocA family oxidoreductase [Armatimonadota bacterium]